MGGSSSKAERREQRRRSETTANNRSTQNTRAPPPPAPAPARGGQQPQVVTQSQPRTRGATTNQRPPQQQQNPYPQQQQNYRYTNQNSYNNRPPVQQQVMQRQESVEIKEGEKIENLATVDRRSITFEPESGTLMFEITCTVPCTYEVHCAVRETVSKGALIYSPNKPKNPPVPIQLDRPYESESCAAQVDLDGVSEQEQTYVKAYAKQIPLVIVLTYKMPDGSEQQEHTDVAILPKPNAYRQLVCARGNVYEVEQLFGAEHAEGEPTVAEVVGGGDGVIQDDDDDLCVICLTEPKNTAVIPCRHLCLCKDCAEELKKHSPKCPVCRGPISQLLSMS